MICCGSLKIHSRFVVQTLFFLMCGELSARIGIAETPENWVNAHLGQLVGLYQEFHQHPELSLQEVETARRFGDALQKDSFRVTSRVGGHGVVGILENGPGKVLMMRADLDGLPVVEQTQLAYASQVQVDNGQGEKVGVMHACGHDMHMTCLLGAARYMAEHRSDWSGTLVVIGQPAEELGSGASAMLEAGLFQNFPKPDFAMALHVDPALAAGKVGCRAGFTLANTDSVDIIVHGKGGHGAFPHTTIDPIVQAAQLVLALQTIVSREIPPTEPAVVTVGSIQAGTKHNIISDQCHLQLTVRSFSDQVRGDILRAIERKAKGIALSANAPEPTIQVKEGTPALFNDEKLTQRLTEVFQQKLGADRVATTEPTMGGEDFSQYGRIGKIPISMFRLGAVEPNRLERMLQLGQTPPSLHSPLFYPDAEPTVTTGVVALCYGALDLLAK